MPPNNPELEVFIRPAQPVDALAMAQVHVDTWRTTYAGIVPEAHLANMSYERSQARWLERLAAADGGQAYVAQTPDGQVVGIASCGTARDAQPEVGGEIYVLYVLKAFQGMGIGRRMLEQAVQLLVSQGYQSMVIWVLKENSPARRFYERLGGQLSIQKEVEIGDKPLVDVAYIWQDLATISRSE